MQLRSLQNHLEALIMNRGPGRRATTRHAIFRLAEPFTPILGVQDKGMTFQVETADRAIGLATYCSGVYELQTMSVALKIVAELGGVDIRGRGFIDIGSNIGTTVIPACRLFGASEAVAVEPSSRNVRQLKSNIVLNDLQSSVKVIQAAVSDAPSVLDLEINDVGNMGDNRIRVSGPQGAPGDFPGEWSEGSWNTEKVQGVVLDDVVGDVGDPAVVWIDTQGHEAHVLKSGLSVSHLPAVIEFWPYGLERAGGAELLNEIISQRYSRVVDVRASEASRKAVTYAASWEQMEELATLYAGPVNYTDLVLLP